MFGLLKQFRVVFRINQDINSRLNKLSGKFGIDRSKIIRLALIDFLTGSNLKRRELDKFERLQKHGQAVWIREEI